jgi:hypothetical protein
MKFILGFVGLVLFLQPALAMDLYKKTSIDVEVDKGITVAIDVYMPLNNAKPKALVIVSPGSDGVGENVFERLNRGEGNPETSDQLADALTKAGYAVAFFWQRGYLRTKDCVKGNSYEEKQKSYVANCYIKEIRANSDLHTTTSDTEKVYEALSLNHLTRNLSVVSLAISEGSYHISKLIQLKKINPAGVVFIGGMFESLAETFAYQFRYDFYFDKMDLAFSKSKKDTISFADLVKYGGINIFIEPPRREPWKAQEAMGAAFITKVDAANRKVMLARKFQEFLFELPTKPLGLPEYGFFDGLLAPSAISSSYLPQAFKATTDIVDQLAEYDRRVFFLYGSFESLIKLPSIYQCPHNKLQCKIEVIEGVGHYLQDQAGLRPPQSLNAILNAIKEVQPTTKKGYP